MSKIFHYCDNQTGSAKYKSAFIRVKGNVYANVIRNRIDESNWPAKYVGEIEHPEMIKYLDHCKNCTYYLRMILGFCKLGQKHEQI